jgi:hypothetical protein
VSVLEVFHKDGIPRFVKFFYNEWITYVSIFFFCESREVHTKRGAVGEKQTSPPACISHHLSLSPCLVLII